jgi:hypothetical protein
MKVYITFTIFHDVKFRIQKIYLNLNDFIYNESVYLC